MGLRRGLDAISYLTDRSLPPVEPPDREVAAKLAQMRTWREKRKQVAEQLEEKAKIAALVASIERKQRETQELLDQLRREMADAKP